LLNVLCSFILRQEIDHASELVSVIVSLFTSSYRMKWVEFFPNKDKRSGASFDKEVLCLKRSEIQAYLAFKQQECENAFGIKYNDLPDKFRLGSCIFKTVVDDRQEIIVVHAENIASRAFLNDYSMILSKELTGFDENALSIGEEHLNLWRVENRMKQDGWVVVRIDGCRFSSFILRQEIDHASELVSVIVSLFTSSYRMKWVEFFPNKDKRSGASFDKEVLCLKRSEIQAYLAFKQQECENAFGIKYNDLPDKFRLVLRNEDGPGTSLIELSIFLQHKAANQR
nr:hypothetical protein [Tanacetum cinerariifolium]